MPIASAQFISASAWEVFYGAVLIRDSLAHHGGDEAAGLTLSGDAQEAIMLGLD